MKEHLNNILNKLDLLDSNYKYSKEKIKLINDLINEFLSNDNFEYLNLQKVKTVSNLIYELNYNNSFSQLTDSISNDFYAFEFLLQNELKKEKTKNE